MAQAAAAVSGGEARAARPSALMETNECPRCRRPLAAAQDKVYCPQCGWSREEVDRQSRAFLRIVPLLVALFDAPLIIYVLVGHARLSALLGLGLLAIVPAVLMVLVVTGKLRIGSLGKSSGRRS